MKNKIILSVVSIALVLTFVFIGKIVLGTIDTQPDEKANKAVANNISKVTEARITLNETRYQSKKTKETLTFPKECSSTLDELAGMTMEESMTRLKSKDDFDLFFPKDCQNALASHETFGQISQGSQCNFTQADFEYTETCSSLLFALKAFTIADNTKDVQLSHLSSQEMAAHFVKMFFSFDKLTKEIFKQNMQLIDAFYEQHPNDPSVLEAYIGYGMIAQQITGEKFASEKMDKIFENAQGKNFKVDRLAVLKDVMKQDYPSAKATLDRLNELYANEAELQYFYAAYYWKQGDRNSANKYLDQAIAMGEKCSYCVPSLYKETKVRMKNAKNGDDKLFSISIGLNFENL